MEWLKVVGMVLAMALAGSFLLFLLEIWEDKWREKKMNQAIKAIEENEYQDEEE